MRINELIVESNNLDEISLAGVGRGIAKGLGGVAKGAGMVAGLGTGMKRAYAQGKATSASAVSNRRPAATPPATPATPPATPATPTPATPTPATPPATPATSGRLGIPAGRQAVDNAVATIKSVRGDRRPQVVAYGLQQLGAIKETKVGIKSNFLGIEI